MLGFFLLLFTTSTTFGGSVSVLPSEKPHAVFGGAEVTLVQQFRNELDQTVEIDAKFRLLQAGSATVMPLSTQPFKKLILAPRQTVLEMLKVTFPHVKAPTRFLVQWRDTQQNHLGTTEAWVYPTNLLRELSDATQSEAIGLIDMNNLLVPALRSAKVKYEDLQEVGLDGFNGKLMIVASFSAEAAEQIVAGVKRKAAAGHAVIWIAPAAGDGPPEPEPISYFYPTGGGAIVAAPAKSVSNLAFSPLAQLTLTHLANLALNRNASPWANAAPVP